MRKQSVDSRPESMCRYFGEVIDTADDDVMETICDKMCDVRNFLINSHILFGLDESPISRRVLHRIGVQVS